MKFLKFTVIFIVCSYLWGCASGAKMENMAYHGEQKNYADEIQENLGLGDVSGGKKTNPVWTSEIGNDAFWGAVKESLESQGLYSDNGTYRLAIKIIKLEQPLLGLDLEVTTHVRYVLTNTDNNAVIFDDTVIAPHTAGLGDAFFAAKRLRLANEGSAQKSIEALLDKLSELRIEPQEISLGN